MDKIVPSFYKRYGNYINHSRAFPLSLDGLKPVERRMLLSVYDVAKEKLNKSFKIDGHCIGNYHPHGSAYGTLVQMVRQGFLVGQGNFGANIGASPDPPAAARYTEAMMKKETLELAFKLIKYVPWIEGEVIGDKEPKFLPTKYPVCLLGKEYSQGIGFGFKTFIPCFEMEDLHKRLLWLIGKRKSKSTIKPITDCDIESKDKDIEEILTKGKGSLKVKGKYTVHKHKNVISVHSWPTGIKFESLLKRFSKEFDSGDIAYDDLSTGEGTNIEFSVLKQRNRDKIFKNLLKKMDVALKGNLNFELNVVDTNDLVRVVSVDEMLLETYKMFTSINKNMLQIEKKNSIESVTELQNLELVKPFLSKELVKKISNKEQMIKAIENISKQSKVKLEIVKELFSKYNINKLLTLNTDAKVYKDKIKDYDSNLKNLEEFVLDQY